MIVLSEYREIILRSFIVIEFLVDGSLKTQAIFL